MPHTGQLRFATGSVAFWARLIFIPRHTPTSYPLPPLSRRASPFFPRSELANHMGVGLPQDAAAAASAHPPGCECSRFASLMGFHADELRNTGMRPPEQLAAEAAAAFAAQTTAVAAVPQPHIPSGGGGGSGFGMAVDGGAAFSGRDLAAEEAASESACARRESRGIHMDGGCVDGDMCMDVDGAASSATHHHHHHSAASSAGACGATGSSASSGAACGDRLRSTGSSRDAAASSSGGGEAGYSVVARSVDRPRRVVGWDGSGSALGTVRPDR